MSLPGQTSSPATSTSTCFESTFALVEDSKPQVGIQTTTQGITTGVIEKAPGPNRISETSIVNQLDTQISDLSLESSDTLTPSCILHTSFSLLGPDEEEEIESESGSESPGVQSQANPAAATTGVKERHLPNGFILKPNPLRPHILQVTYTPWKAYRDVVDRCKAYLRARGRPGEYQARSRDEGDIENVEESTIKEELQPGSEEDDIKATVNANAPPNTLEAQGTLSQAAKKADEEFEERLLKLSLTEQLTVDW